MTKCGHSTRTIVFFYSPMGNRYYQNYYLSILRKSTCFSYKKLFEIIGKVIKSVQSEFKLFSLSY